MQNIKSSVYSAMLTSPALSLLVSDRVYFKYPQQFSTLPVISYCEQDNTGSLYADDEELGSEITFEIKAWNTGSTTALENAVISAMTTYGGELASSADSYDDGSKMYYREMIFKINITE